MERISARNDEPFYPDIKKILLTTTEEAKQALQLRIQNHQLVQQITQENPSLLRENISNIIGISPEQLSNAISHTSTRDGTKSIKTLLEIQTKLEKLLEKEKITKTSGTRTPKNQRHTTIGCIEMPPENFLRCIEKIQMQGDKVNGNDIGRTIDAEAELKNIIQRIKRAERVHDPIISVRNDIWEKLQQVLSGEIPLVETRFEKKWGKNARKIDEKNLRQLCKFIKSQNGNLTETAIIQKIGTAIPELSEEQLHNLFANGGGLMQETAEKFTQILFDMLQSS